MKERDAGRIEAVERVKHLNAVLHAIWKVNQLIIKEKDCKQLLQGNCDILIETRGYYSAWIAILDASGRLVASAEAGLGKAFLPFVEQLKRGELTACAQRALSQPGVVVTDDPPSTCADCPLTASYAGRGGMTVRLEHGGRVYGLLAVSIPAHLIGDEEEQGLFGELAKDIAFALQDVEEDHKRAEQAIQETTQEYAKSIVETVREPLLVLDSDLRVISANRSFYQRFQMTPEETLNQPIYSLGEHQWDIPKLRELLERILLKNTSFNDCVLEHDFETIGHRTMLLNARRLLEKNEEQRILLAIEDITERKAMQERLLRAEKLAVLGQLASGVGHELRNPLSAIKNASYFLNMALEELDPEVKETLKILEKEVGNSERIISDLLDFARTKPPTKRKVDVNALLQETLAGATVPEQVKVVRKLDEAIPAILADPDQLRQVFSNLILNAFQAIPEVGELTVASKSASSGWVQVSVSDTGTGISKEQRDKLFEPLFTTKAKGIGLGLAVAKSMVEIHGGTIEVQSEVGKGAVFTVRLPSTG